MRFLLSSFGSHRRSSKVLACLDLKMNVKVGFRLFLELVTLDQLQTAYEQSRKRDGIPIGPTFRTRGLNIEYGWRLVTIQKQHNSWSGSVQGFQGFLFEYFICELYIVSSWAGSIATKIGIQCILRYSVISPIQFFAGPEESRLV